MRGMAGPSDIDPTGLLPTIDGPTSGPGELEAPLAAHTRLGGRYVVERKLGAGGMGTVYAAHDTLVDQPVALKFVRRELMNEGELKRLRQEVRLAQSVTHEHVARTFTLEELEGQLFIVMELLRGETLAARIARGPLPLGEALSIARALLEGLAAAHRRGVTHRDLKPANIMLCHDGRTVLMDFGLARAHQAPAPPGALPASSLHTQSGLGGTPGYMAPEVLRGEPSGPAADLYAVGIVLFEMLIGRGPFSGTTPMELFAAQLDHRVPDPASLRRDVPARVGQATLRLVARDPARRFSSAEETLAALELPRRARTRPALALSALALGVAAIAVWRWPERPPEGPIAAHPARAEVDRSLVHGAIDGRVVSWSTSRPVAGAELIFGAGGKTLSVRTGADGAFALEATEAGPLRLQVVSADGYLPFAPAWGTSPIELVSRPRVRLRDLTLYLTPAIAYEGRVEDPSGRPAAGAQVRLLGTRAGEQALVPIRDLFATDADGRFGFHAPDGAVLEARLPGAPPGRARVDDKAQLTHRLVIRLGSPARTRSGRISGRVLDPAGKPVAQALVAAEPAIADGEDAWPSTRVQAETDADGRFAFEELSAADYAVVVNRAGLSPAVAPRVALGSELALTLGGGSVLSGTVKDQTGRPVSAFAVQIHRRLGPLRLEPLVGRVIADSQGAFEIAGLPAGPVHVTLRAYGYAAGDGDDLTLGAAPARISVVLGRGGRVVGTVVDARDGKPIALARVDSNVHRSDGGASAIPEPGSAITDGAGHFELLGVSPGRQSIAVAAFGHHTRIVSGLDVADGRDTGPVRVALAPLGPGEQPALELAGIGAVLTAGDDAILVKAVLAKGGAEAAGLQSGDGVLAVDGRAVTALGLDRALEAIRGPAGTSVHLRVRRGAEQLERRVERRPIKSP